MNSSVAWSWRGRLALVAVPVLGYLVGLGLALDLKDSAAGAHDVMTVALGFGSFTLRMGSIGALALTLYQLLFTRPGHLVPKWMVVKTDDPAK